MMTAIATSPKAMALVLRMAVGDMLLQEPHQLRPRILVQFVEIRKVLFKWPLGHEAFGGPGSQKSKFVSVAAFQLRHGWSVQKGTTPTLSRFSTLARRRITSPAFCGAHKTADNRLHHCRETNWKKVFDKPVRRWLAGEHCAFSIRQQPHPYANVARQRQDTNERNRPTRTRGTARINVHVVHQPARSHDDKYSLPRGSNIV